MARIVSCGARCAAVSAAVMVCIHAGIAGGQTTAPAAADGRKVDVGTLRMKVVDPMLSIIDENRFHGVFEREVNANFDDAPDLKAIQLVAPRNGYASGQVVLIGPQLVAVRAGCEGLTGPECRVSPDNIRISYAVRHQYRYPFVFPKIFGEEGGRFIERFTNTAFYDNLEEQPAKDGNILPIWVTVHVPADAAPGVYQGKLQAAGAGVPVTLKVCDWKCPDPRDWTGFAGIIHSAEALSVIYNAPMWGEAHWKLVERQFANMGALGNNMVHITTWPNNHLGQERPLVCFRKSGDSYKADFSLAREYMKRYLKYNSPPRSLILHLWDSSLQSGREVALKNHRAPPGPKIGVLDGEKFQVVELPYYDDPASEKMWKDVTDEFRQLAHGWGCKDENIFIGMAQDIRPDPACWAMFDKIAPYARWAIFTHGRGDPQPKDGKLLMGDSRSGGLGGGRVNKNEEFKRLNVGHYELPEEPCFRRDNPVPPEDRGILAGWNVPLPVYSTRRNSLLQYAPLSQYRYHPDATTGHSIGYPPGDMGGYSRLCLDFWEKPDVKTTYPYGQTFLDMTESWNNLYRQCPRWIIAAGRNGPIPTGRYEMLREGSQELEARISIERAILGGKVSGDLETRCRDFLEKRARRLAFSGTNRKDGGNGTAFISMPADWRNWTATLFDLAGEVQRQTR